MPRDVVEIAADLEALAAFDFNDANTSARGRERLVELCDEIQAVNDPAVCAPILFSIMERLDGVEFGTPGAIVHTLEKWRGAYEEFLVQSVRRKPTPHTVWMVNRIMNSDPPDADFWLALLRSVANNPSASVVSKAEAEDFIKYQTGGA